MKTTVLLFLLLLSSSFAWSGENDTYALTVHVANLRNAEGVVQFALYDKEGTLPDEKFERYRLKQVAEISNSSATTTFTDLPEGTYAVNILHDEDSNGKIKKGFVLPTEGIGFSNYSSIGLTNRPNFSGASFHVGSDMEIEVMIIYF